MLNRHGVAETMDNNLNQRELIRTLSDAGYKHALMGVTTSPQETVISGSLCFDTLPSGLRVHCTDTIEKSTGQMVSEIQPMISINVLLKGQLSFALNDQDHHFNAQQQPITFVNLVTKPSIFKRYFNTGHNVKKVNISVEPSWLIARCKRTQDQQAIQQIFNLEPNVFNWQASKTFQQKVLRLLELHEKSELIAAIEEEQLAFQIVTECYQKLAEIAAANTNDCDNKSASEGNKENKYEEQIEQLIEQSFTLDELAQTLGASISTLQRYFKRVHKLTLKHYIRNQKLELARRLLIFEQKSIGEVAFAVGYNHSSNFTKAFKTYFKVTPAELQKQYL